VEGSKAMRKPLLFPMKIPSGCAAGDENIGEAVSGEVTVDKAMDNLAEEMDKVMERIARSGTQGECGPKLNEKKDEKYWLDQPGAPKAKVEEKPKGETVNYDELIKAWREGRVE